jgi:hypothetical protein
MPRAPDHHVVVPPSHKRPRLGLRGWRRQARPLVPPGRRDVVVRDLHRRRLGAAGEGGLLLHHHDRLRPRPHGCGFLLRRRDRHLQLCLGGRGCRTILHGRRHRLRHRDWRLRLRLRHLSRLRRGRHLPCLRDRRPQPSGRCHQPRPRGLGRALRTPARRRRACGRPRRPRRTPPGGDGRVCSQHLGRCEGRHGRYHPANTKTECHIPARRARDPSKGNSLPQGGEGPLPLPRGPP